MKERKERKVRIVAGYKYYFCAMGWVCAQRKTLRRHFESLGSKVIFPFLLCLSGGRRSDDLSRFIIVEKSAVEQAVDCLVRPGVFVIQPTGIIPKRKEHIPNGCTLDI